MWITAFGKEFGVLAQGYNRVDEKGSNAIFMMNHDEIKIPADGKIKYGSLVVDYREQKIDPNRVWLPAGGSLIKYPGKTTTKTADLTTSKVLCNSVLSLCAPMDRYKYMHMRLEIFPQHIIEQ